MASWTTLTNIYINPPDRYQCPAGMVLKLLKTIYVTFSTTVLDAVCDHALFSEIDIFNQTTEPLDLYQGSRLMAKLT